MHVVGFVSVEGFVEAHGGVPNHNPVEGSVRPIKVSSHPIISEVLHPKSDSFKRARCQVGR